MKLYYSLLSIFVTLTLGKCEMLMDESMRIDLECKKEIGVTEEFFRDYPDDTKTKCYDACTMKKEGSMVDGKISTEKLLEFAVLLYKVSDNDKAKAKGIEQIKKCIDNANEETQECEVAAAFYKCLMKNFN